MINIIFIAPPAAGKGTYSKKLEEEFGYSHLATGDMLREAINLKTPLGLKVKDIMAQGKLVDDEIVINLIAEKLGQDGKPFILDGFPRTLNQAEKLDVLLEKLAKDYIVINLDVKKEVALARIQGRLMCSCGKSYNALIPSLKPKREGICDVCGQKLIKREDDNEESFLIRYNSYLEKTEPIINYYSQNQKLVKIDASRSAQEVYQDLIEVIKW